MSTETSNAPGGFVIGAFALAVTIGGANFLAVRFSNRELEPFWGAGLRFSLAAAIFVIIAVVLRLPWPRGRQLRLTVAYGLLGFAIDYALMYWALTQVTAGMATVVLAIVPLVTVLLAAAQRLETLRARSLAGALLALAGIAWVAFGPGATALPLSALLAMSGSAGETWVLPGQPEVVWSLAYLVTIGSVGLFVILLLVIRQWTASTTSYMFVLFPVVTMLLGAWLADEPVTIYGATGALLVMAGVWVGALSSTARRLASSDSTPGEMRAATQPG